MSVVDPHSELAPSRYVVGMDLGTTNSAVAYVDTLEQPWQVRVFPIPQVVAPGQVEPRETLPSFHYQPIATEAAGDSLRLPWQSKSADYAVGVYARDQGALVPGRLIASAKSWLCHAGVDRRGAILPWHAAEDVERLSPVQVSARYLRQVRDAWNARFPQDPLEQQDFVLTLPASFDEVARELTVEAAADAGLPRVVLIEEPQAAFYAWLCRHPDQWRSQVEPGQKILVCDIGGGTSDFTLIRVREAEAGKVQFHRVAVGEHLILGGDNLDLALARHLESRVNSGGPLSPRQWDVLVRSCRRVKEELLVEQGPETLSIHLPSGGAKLIGGGLRVDVTREEVHRWLIDGFFPLVPLDSRPDTRRSGFQEFGLPYASDPAITSHLAAFLTAHRHAGSDMEAPSDGEARGATTAQTSALDHDPARPDIVLFNGGLFESSQIQRRILDALQSWFRTAQDPTWTPRVLAHDRLDLAVARGAAYYGMVRRGEGVKITANLARSYYIGVERSAGDASDSPASRGAAICLLPGNAEPGQEFRLSEHRLQLLVSQPVEFPLYVSSTRLADRAGVMLEIDLEQMRALPPIRTVLKTRRRADATTADVELHAKLTEIGTLDLWCAELDGSRRWRLQFDVRSATQTDLDGHESASESEGLLDEDVWRQCCAVLASTFGPDAAEAPDGVMKRLVAAAEMDRHEWPTSLLRRIAEQLLEWEAGRRRSPLHEARWLNLLGYTLRPGYGLAVDDWRVSETWKTIQGKLAFAAAANRTESLILWRRVAGGLSAGQQLAVAEPLLAPVRALHRRLTTGKDRGSDGTFSPHEATETWRLLGSLELLPLSVKHDLGRMLVDLLPKKKVEAAKPAMAWALGRLGSREPVYGPLNTVAAAETARRWLVALLEQPPTDPNLLLAVTLLARRTGDRYRDLQPDDRRRALAWLEACQAPQHYCQLVAEGGRLDAEEQGKVFGESLPVGLRLA
ncbi:MAG: Hsp70 family protein [Pirellulales bacterium]